MNRELHKIDATGKVLGRLATEIANLLRGKHKVEFVLHLDMGDIVEVSNYDKIKVTGNKMEDKIYYRHSGYPGGLKETTLKEKMEKDPIFPLRNAVYHMLPKNKLRDKMIKRLKFVESK
jgi:large subunit ribosomal protein L13